MGIEKDMLPDTVDELKALIVNLQNEFQSEKLSLQSENKSLNNKINLLEEKLKAAFARFFSPSKDKLSAGSPEQLFLFNESEAHADAEGGLSGFHTLARYVTQRWECAVFGRVIRA